MKKQVFMSLVLICLSFTFAFGVKASENSILTAHWDFNEGSGTVAHDGVSGYNGALTGLVRWGDGFIDFNSGDNLISHGYIQTGWIPKTKNFTMILSVSGGGGGEGGDDRILFVNNGFQLMLRPMISGSSIILHGLGINDEYIGVNLGSLNRIALVDNGSTIKIFNNGQYIKTFNNVAPIGEVGDTIWDWYFGGGNGYIKSQYYDLKLYNIALSDNEILSEYVNGELNCTQDEWNCSDWGVCQIGGNQTRTCTMTYDCPIVETSPETSQSCVPACTQDEWTCNDWDVCQLNGTQVRNCSKTFDCSNVETPSPETAQTCTPACTQDTWNCSDWNTCQPNSTQIRTCAKTFDCSLTETPSPLISQSCIYTAPQCTANDWKCSDWGICKLNRTQTRTCSKTTNCEGGVAQPVITKSCRPVCTLLNIINLWRQDNPKIPNYGILDQLLKKCQEGK